MNKQRILRIYSKKLLNTSQDASQETIEEVEMNRLRLKALSLMDPNMLFTHPFMYCGHGIMLKGQAILVIRTPLTHDGLVMGHQLCWYV